MPESQQPAEGERIMAAEILTNPCRCVLDVGAGDGKWGRILKGKVKRIVGLEVWSKYIRKYKLHTLYDKVVQADARRFNDWQRFDVIILGDVLEHMMRDDALALIEKLRQAGPRVYLTIPITPDPQDGSVYGNPYETHLDQWTHEELEAQGWKLLHRGLNPNKKVMIGTYVLDGE